MLCVDFHSHSQFSCCGVHTTLELLTSAKAKGVKALAITDHGLTLKGRLISTFFDRLTDPVPGIRLLKGIECNLLEEPDNPGAIDCPTKFLPYLDIVLLGIHQNVSKGLGRARYTEMLLEAMEKNSHVDIIAHPNVAGYEVEFEPVAKAALKHGMALELNNSKTALNRTSPEVTEDLILTCKALECPVVVSSDAHTLNEIGQDEAIQPVLDKLGFPEELILNRAESTAMAFIEGRRKHKQLFPLNTQAGLRKTA